MKYVRLTATVFGFAIAISVAWWMHVSLETHDARVGSTLRGINRTLADATRDIGTVLEILRKPDDATTTYCRNAATTAQAFYQHWAMSPCAQPSEDDGTAKRLISDVAAVGSWATAIYREVQTLRRYIRNAVQAVCQ